MNTLASMIPIPVAVMASSATSIPPIHLPIINAHKYERMDDACVTMVDDYFSLRPVDDLDNAFPRIEAPYASRIHAELPVAESISYFHLSLERYAFWEDDDPTENAFVFKHPGRNEFMLGGSGFVIFRNVKGTITSSFGGYGARLFIFDPATRIAVDSVLPVDHEDVPAFKEDFEVFLRSLKGLGVNVASAETHIIYGANDELINFYQESGLDVARMVHESGLRVHSLIPAFDHNSRYMFSLEDGSAKVRFGPADIAMQQRALVLDRFLTEIKQLIVAQSNDVSQTALIATLIEILEALNAKLPTNYQLAVQFSSIDEDQANIGELLLKITNDLSRRKEILAVLTTDDEMREYRQYLADEATSDSD